MESENWKLYVIDKNRRVLGEIRSMCSGLKVTKSLNRGVFIEFSLDYEQFQSYIGANTDPRAWLRVKAVDIVAVLNDVPFGASRLTSWQPNFSEDALKLNVKCTPLIDFYNGMIVSPSFTSDTAQGEIFWWVINNCNIRENGDYGIRKGPNVAQFKRTRNETDKVASDFLTRMTKVRNGLDFDISPSSEIMNGAYHKILNTYDMMGKYWKNETWVFGDDDRIQGFGVKRGEEISNVIVAIGSGNGTAAIRTIQQDSDSQQIYYRQEKLVTYNSIVNMQPLIENAQGVLDAAKHEVEIPFFTFKAGTFDYNRIDVGDTINAICTKYPIFQINGQYRIVELVFNISDQDNTVVQPFFDDYNIDDIVSGQSEDDS